MSKTAWTINAPLDATQDTWDNVADTWDNVSETWDSGTVSLIEPEKTTWTPVVP